MGFGKKKKKFIKKKKKKFIKKKKKKTKTRSSFIPLGVSSIRLLDFQKNPNQRLFQKSDNRPSLVDALSLADWQMIVGTLP